MINKNAPLRFARPGLTAALALGGLLLVSAMPAAAQAQDCGGVLSPTTGNVVGTVAGAAAGGLIGNQFGKGTGQGVMTGLGVVGGALAGGYVGRQVEGCGRGPAPASAATGGRAPPRQGVAGDARSCRYVLTQAVIDGREQQVNGIACLEADGVWRTASGPAAERAAETDLVFRAQQSLRDQGYFVRNNIDGRWGPATSTAVRNFQRANGLGASGQLDLATQQSLGIGPAAQLAQAQGVQGVQGGTVQPVAVPAASSPLPPAVPARR